MLKIYNSMTRQKQELVPMTKDHIKMYVCGVTVYDDCHIGHARTYVSIDVIVRYLRSKGFKVTYVRNITDIDDKIIKRAAENQEDIQALTSRFIDAMNKDFEALGIKTPDYEPRATDYISNMTSLIGKIIENGHAYVSDNGDVYFNVQSYPGYGALSQHNIQDLEAGARVEVSDVKRNPLDFVLWKAAKPHEPSWPSPWGQGRPGWHIECSSMALDLLGEEFDIHAGGKDLIFPHHENELAQSHAGTKKNFANIWMHCGFLQIEKEKMSKSLGNFITIKEVLEKHSAEVVRFLLLSSHYRSPLVYSEELLQQAKQSLTRLYTALRGLETQESMSGTRYESLFKAAMDDDFNTPVALSHLFELAHEVQRLRQNDLNAATKHAGLLKKLANDILGILYDDPDQFLQSGQKADTQHIEALIRARENARQQKDWTEADRIRQELSALSIIIEDTPEGTLWRNNK